MTVWTMALIDALSATLPTTGKPSPPAAVTCSAVA